MNVQNLIKTKEVTEVLQQLIRIPSQNPPGEERECANYIADKMCEWGFNVEIIRKPFPLRPQVVVKYEGTQGSPKLILNSHIDTVPVGDIDKWSVGPFSGVIKNGRVYGRGSCDAKSGIASIMLATKAIKDRGLKLKGDLILQFAVGEETGEPGTRYLLVEKGIKGDWGIVIEPTNLKVSTAEKGLMWFYINIEGKSCHAATPELGINAIDKAVELIRALKRYNHELSTRRHPLLGKAFCSVTVIHGGIKENTIPASCRLVIDRRFLPGEIRAKEELMNILLDIQKRDAEFKYKIERVVIYEPAEIPVNSYIAQVLRECTYKITGVYSEPYGTLFSSDVRNFVNDANIPAVTWGPGDPSRAHTVDECIEIDQVVKATRILVLTIMKLLT